MQRDTATIAALVAGGLGLLAASRMERLPARPVRTFRVSDRYDAVDVHMPMRNAVGGLVALVGGGLLISSLLRRGPGTASDSNVQESIELDVPVSVAYNQWTQFEDFPKFMGTVQEVKQINDTHLRWKAIVGGKTKEWESEITEQIPDKRIAWRSTMGPRNAGVVTFHKVSDNRTRVMLQMDYAPESLGERAADAVGAVKLTAKGNLMRFKQLVEQRGTSTGAWRGTVPEH